MLVDAAAVLAEEPTGAPLFVGVIGRDSGTDDDLQYARGDLVEVFRPLSASDFIARVGGQGRRGRFPWLIDGVPGSRHAVEGDPGAVGAAGALNTCLTLCRSLGAKAQKVATQLAAVAPLLCRLHLFRRRFGGAPLTEDVELGAVSERLRLCARHLKSGGRMLSGRHPFHAAERDSAAVVANIASIALAAAEHAAECRRPPSPPSLAPPHDSGLQLFVPAASPHSSPARAREASPVAAEAQAGSCAVSPVVGPGGVPGMPAPEQDVLSPRTVGALATVVDAVNSADETEQALLIADALFYGTGTGGRRELTRAFEIYKKYADVHARAAWKVGEALYHGWGVTADKQEAMQWFRHGAGLGCFRCAAALAEMLEAEPGGCAEACLFWRQAADGGHVPAMLALGRLAECGTAGAALPPAAAHWYATATATACHGAEADEARCRLADLLFRSPGSVAAGEAVELLREAVEGGHGGAATTLGWLVESGAVQTENSGSLEHRLREALLWYQRAVEMGSSDAAVHAGYCHLVLGDFTEGIAALTAGAAEGKPEAVYCLGEAYRWGVGVARDHAEALRLFTDASKEGHVRALVREADAVYTGTRDAPDPLHALELYCSAAGRGDAEACVSAAVLLEDGAEGVEPSPRRAALWHRRAGELRKSTYHRWDEDAVALLFGPS
eukprot:TRINITY_DN39880_c0_g1_i1.p1 TRINITY_DN39880_c0_g1~~TRINITY_DN39880_c0_g1_i1.p1  ORF type:complete len:671 (+),score=174.93 TRINITY_DN39880_c0_g1_i1:59-2071(+)